MALRSTITMLTNCGYPLVNSQGNNCSTFGKRSRIEEMEMEACRGVEVEKKEQEIHLHNKKNNMEEALKMLKTKFQRSGQDEKYPMKNE
jgi:hypothetical protein